MRITYKTSAMRTLSSSLAIVIFGFFSLFNLSALAADNYPAKDLTISDKSSLPPGWDYQSSSSNPHGIIVVLGANPRINDIPLKFGDYIGAFFTDDNGILKCAGADFWTGTENIIFPVFGNNPETPEKDGFSFGETMYFKVYYKDNNKDYNVDELQWDPEYASSDKWYPFGLSSITDLACNVTFDAYATISSNPICVGQTIELEAHIFVETTGNYTYSWSSLPEGFASTLINPTDTPQSSIRYNLEVFDGTNYSNHAIDLVVNEHPQVVTSEDQTICINQSAGISATATNASAVMWASNGDGTFTYPNSLASTYFPGVIDKENSEVTLTIFAYPLSPCANFSTDEVNIFLEPLPEISLIPEYNFCENQDMIVEAEAINHAGVLWTTNGDGTFSSPDSLTTHYFPGTSDLVLNEFILTVCATAVLPCLTSACVSTQINTHNTPTVNVPGSRTSCENSPVNINSIAFNYSSTLWTSQGDGTFLNPNLLNTKYFPGPEDIAAGGNIININAFGNGFCQDFPVTKNLQIILIAQPEVNAGDDTEVCVGNLVHLAGEASDYTYVNWTSGGDGFFANNNILDAIYYPGPVDFNSESFELYLLANPISPCNGTITDTIKVFPVPGPEIEIGVNQAWMCFDSDYYFSQTETSNSSSFEWFSINGGGTFDDNTILHPTYFPNPETDYNIGCIVIGVIAHPEQPCTSAVEDYMSLCFSAPPQAFAGDDATITSIETFIPNSFAINQSSVNWETSGDGTFDDYTLIAPEYTPGASDTENYLATLSFIAEPGNGCVVAAYDTLDLTILRNQEIWIEQGSSGFSLFIDATGKSLEEVLAPVSGQLIFAQNFTDVYWPEYNINTIGDFSNLSGYRVVLNSGATLQVSGYETSQKLILLKEGWNILPVLSSCAINTGEIIDQLDANLIIITEMDGDAVAWPNGNLITLTELMPGKAYMIKLTKDISFTTPECVK